MDENMKKEQTSGEIDTKKWNLKQYIIIALIVFATFCCCILFFFMIYRYNGFADSWKKLTVILQPITIGVVLAYLLNPVMKFLEKYLLRFFGPRMKNARKAAKTCRGIAIAGSLVFLLGIIILLIAAVVPAMIDSIQGIIVSVPEGFNQLITWVDDFTKGDTKIAEIANELIEKISAAIQNFIKNDILPQIQTYIAQITTGVIYGVKLFLNIIIGIIISIYVMASKETFAGQAKKVIYAMFKPVRANVIIQTVRKSNEIFGGFISGKLLDSAIIGVLAYIVLAIMRMPDTVLIAVIVGVTNIIPFFGPFIGAIPSFIIIVLQDPLKGLYFLVFIIVLQQIDGNIIGPKILGNSTGLSSFWVVFAILVFGGVWGFFGMLLGVPIMAVIYYIVEQVVEYYLRKRGLKEETEKYVHLVKVDKNTNEMLYGTGSTQNDVSEEPEKEEKTDVKF